MTDKKEPHMGRFAEAQENVEIGEKCGGEWCVLW